MGDDGYHTAHVLQASGMVSAQADCTPEDALLILKARARSSDVSLAYVAAAVLRGEIRFDD